jgi:hypothetical protein
LRGQATHHGSYRPIFVGLHSKAAQTTQQAKSLKITERAAVQRYRALVFSPTSRSRSGRRPGRAI